MLKYRPSDDIIAEFNQYLVDFWDCMNSTFEEIEVYINNNSDNPAAELRSTRKRRIYFPSNRFVPIC